GQGREQDLVVLTVVAGGGDLINDGRQWRDVPDHRQGAVLRVQRQCQLVGEDQIIDGGLLGSLDPGVGDVLPLGGGDDLRVVRVEEQGLLGFEEVLFVRGGCYLGDTIGV